MKSRHLILMLLEVLGGEINSKTKLQKEVYFISLCLNKDLEFKAHYYGPYSLEVEHGLDELIGAGFVDVSRNKLGFNKHGFEIKRYDFSLTELGTRFAKTLINENPNEYKIIKDFTGKLEKVENYDYLTLSIAAKAYFILNNEGIPLTKEQIIEKAKSFDWEIEENDINVAVDILEKINFVNNHC